MCNLYSITKGAPALARRREPVRALVEEQEEQGHLDAFLRPLANSRFHHQPDPQHRPNSRLEAAYHRADTAIQRDVDLVAAA